MSTITTRSGKGSPLTNAEVDDNFVNLNSDKLESSSYTAADVLSKLSSVDGDGSGLDADLLDGQHGSHYLNTATTFGGDVSGTYDALVIADDSHDHIIGNIDGLQSALDSKQDTLVSGTTIKTVNSQSVLGSGNIQIDGGVTSFNTRTGAVSLTSTDVTDALTFTPISSSGNAATATALETARTIGGVSFDGTANINLPGVNTSGNQSTTGNAATATTLQTARTINGVSFDGSANITVADSTKLPLAGGTMSGDLLIVKDYPKFTLDSSSSGGNLIEQAALLSLGESGSGGSAALHLAYTGDGYGYIGMGPANPIPTYDALKFYYTSDVVYIQNRAEAVSSLRAPIFYDTDNTSYYVNPTLTSYFSGLTVAHNFSPRGGGGQRDVGVGTAALYAYSQTNDGNYLSAIGYRALTSATTSCSGMTAVGALAAESINGAGTVAAFGYKALNKLGSFQNGCAVGSGAAQNASSSGIDIAAFGNYALSNCTTGTGNTAIGNNAADITTTGANNITIGYNADPSSSTASGQCTLGSTAITNLRCNDTTISTLSDARDKTDVVDCPFGLSFLSTLRPVQFKWETREGNAKDGMTRLGFIAQELLEATQGQNHILDLVMEDNPDRLEAKAGNLVPIVVKAIKELSVDIDAIKVRLDTANI